MRIDLHLHSRHSPDSWSPLPVLVELARAQGQTLFTLTDHESVDGCLEFPDLGSGLVLLPGLELTCPEGDFLIFAPEVERLRPLTARGFASIKELPRGRAFAVVWAHPLTCKHGDAQSEFASGAPLAEVMACVDGVEILNGKVLAAVALGEEPADYLQRIRALAQSFGKSLCGGSDSHQPFSYLTCWTNFPPDAATPSDLCAAIKAGRTSAGCEPEYFRRLARAVGLTPPPLP